MNELVLIVYLDGRWKIEPAAKPGCTQEGDEYCVVTIRVSELLEAIEAGK